MQDFVMFSKSLHYILLSTSHSLSPVQIFVLSHSFQNVQKVFSFWERECFHSHTWGPCE